MYCNKNEKLTRNFEVIFDGICKIESIVKLTQKACQEQELLSNYYSLPNGEKFQLSQERNHYINMLAITLTCVEDLKNSYLNLEQNFDNYSSTPTIAADR